MSSETKRLPIIAIARDGGGMFTDGDWIESKDLSEDGIRYLTTGSVGIGEFKNQGDGYISEETFERLQCTEVKPGDVLICRLNLPTGRACIVPDLGQKLVTSVDNVIVRPSHKYDRRYLVYALSTKSHLEHASNLARGTTMKRISRSALGRIRMEMPDRNTQTLVADFLDAETRRIDGLITEKGSFITLLREKRVAVISQAVTKGLDANAPMKPSGADWLEDVPTHWDVVRLGVLFKEANRKGDPDLPVLSVSIHDGVSSEEVADEDRARKVALSEDRSVYQSVLPGDLVYNMMRAWQGGFGAVSTDGLVSPAYVVASPLSDARTRFIELQLRTPQAVEEMRRYSKGIADFRMRLYWEHFRNVRVALPPLAEQDEILAKIDRETSRINGLIHETERSIELLKEKRSALITAAVTGKFDVRSLA